MKTKRILATLALAATVFTTSCAEPATLMDFIPQSYDSLNLNGTKISWAWSKGGEEHAYYEWGTPQYDFLIEKIDSIENELNCEIEAIIDEDKVNMDAIKIKMMSGTPSHDIITAGGTSDLAVGGLIYSLTDLSDYIDLKNTIKFGPLTAQEAYMYNGEVYGVIPAQWPGFEPMGGYVIAYNRDLFKENGLTDPHEYYENETWTYNTFENEFIGKSNIQDNEGNPVDVLLLHESNWYQALIHSNQVQFVEKQSDGTLVANPYSSSFINAMTWGENLVDNYRDKLNFEDTRDIESYRLGLNLSALAYTQAFTTGNIAYNDLGNFESGLMPFPCGPDATYGEWTSCMVHIYGFMIPITSVNAEASAMVIDRLAEPFETFGGDAGLLEYYKDNIFMNERDAEIFVEISKNTSYTYANVAGSLGTDVRSGFQDVLYNANTSITTAMDRYRDMLTELIEEWMIPNYEAVYGNE
ncbi:MAG: carbohydrate ABC transporter substrate-binding protein [Ruminococcaceae bacterium]|nr:carbohydrate ABC transporter substrate-binding protein [Oscillospiraceae bacterium]